MNLYFTKIKWAGSNCILITDSNNPRKPIVILEERDIKELNLEFERDLEWIAQKQVKLFNGIAQEI